MRVDLLVGPHPLAANSVDRRDFADLAGQLGVDDLSVLNQGGWANGDVFLANRGGARVVIKTYRLKPKPIRWLGRYLLARERRAYRALAGIDGVPELLDLPDPLSLAIEYVAGERISNQLLADHGETIIASLTNLIETMHRRGVYHMDLRNQGNILIDAQYQATVLDFASAVIIRPGGGVTSAFAGLCRRFDLYGVSKWAERARASA